MRRHREREVTFKVKRSWRMPDLSRSQPDGGAVDASTDELQATYFDTPQNTLQRLGVTLRRRTGGTDAGWHLKVSDGPARTEFQSRRRSQRLPEALNRRIAGVLAGEELAEVATITTTRQATRLRDQHSAVVVEVADDRVSGATLGETAKLDRWREVEVELGPAGDEEVLTKITKIFRRADARPAKLQRKLDRLVTLNGTEPARRTSSTGRWPRTPTSRWSPSCSATSRCATSRARGGAQDPGGDPPTAQHAAQLRPGVRARA